MSRLAILEKGKPVCSVMVWGTLSIGRGPDNDLQIPDTKVSRHHCLIERQGSEINIRDLGSSNGTYVNGKRVEKTSLSHGDVIRLGETELLFEREGATFVVGNSKDGDFPKNLYQIEGIKGFFHYGAVTRGAFQVTLEKLSTLFEIGNIINTHRDSESMTRAVLQQIVRIIQADRYFLFLKEENSRNLRLVAVHPEGESQGGEDFPVSQTILHAVLKEGMSILSVDTSRDRRFREAKSVITYGINSVMCVPVKSHEKIMGIIQVDSRDPTRFFTKEDLNLLTAVGISAGIALENINLYENLKRLFLSTVRSLVTALEASDPYTGGHSLRVAAYAKEVANFLHLPLQEVEEIELAAYLHDIGKIGVPTQVLNKPSSYSDEEFEIVRKHPVTGYEILMKIEGMERIARIVRHHHERFDGKGYPDGLAGEEIPLGSRILGAVDTFDAIVTDRPYRRGRQKEKAIEEIIAWSGTQFDPRVVAAFKACFEKGRVQGIWT